MLTYDTRNFYVHVKNSVSERSKEDRVRMKERREVHRINNTFPQTGNLHTPH